MTKIERARRTHFKRVAAGCDVIKVQLGTAPDEMFHDGWLERRELVGVAFEFGKKIRVANAGDLDSFDIAVAFIARVERGEEVEVVEHGKGWREGADEIFLAVGIDAVFHAHAGIGLRQSRRGNPHQPYAAMAGGGGKAGDVQHGAAADGDEIGMAVNVMTMQVAEQIGDERDGIFRGLTAGDEQRRADELQTIGVRGKIFFDLAFQFRQCLGERIFEDDHRTMRAVAGQRVHQRQIVRREDILGEADTAEALPART